MFFFFLLTSVGGEVMLERLGKTPVVPPLAPGHEEPRNVFAQIPKLEGQETNISAKGMADTAGQYSQRSRAACKFFHTVSFPGASGLRP
jgi:hypothetical protein